jgi:hypothetical protein
VTNHGGWSVADGVRLVGRADGAWETTLPAPEEGQTEPLAFRFVLSDGSPEVDETGEPVGPRRLPRLAEDEASGDRPLVFEFRVRGFGEGCGTGVRGGAAHACDRPGGECE